MCATLGEVVAGLPREEDEPLVGGPGPFTVWTARARDLARVSRWGEYLGRFNALYMIPACDPAVYVGTEYPAWEDGAVTIYWEHGAGEGIAGHYKWRRHQ